MDNIKQKPVAWPTVRERLRADRRRIDEAVSADGAEGSSMRMLFPAYACVLLFRLSNYCYSNGHRRLARCFWLLNVLLTGSDILPVSDIEGGLYIPHPAGISVFCNAGSNLTIMIQSGIGSLYRDDTGYQTVPVLGDNVTLQHHSGVFGAVTVGSNVVISSGCVVTENVGSDTNLVARPLKMKKFIS